MWTSHPCQRTSLTGKAQKMTLRLRDNWSKEIDKGWVFPFEGTLQDAQQQ
jgi:hypothetical protein